LAAGAGACDAPAVDGGVAAGLPAPRFRLPIPRPPPVPNVDVPLVPNVDALATPCAALPDGSIIFADAASAASSPTSIVDKTSTVAGDP